MWRRPSKLTASVPEDEGKITGQNTPGDLLWAFTYDAVGRLMRAVRYESDGLGGVQVARTEDYYYDGVRRIEELLDAGEQDEAVRDYVWGPSYVDEIVCQIEVGVGEDPDTYTYYLQDANYNVVGLVDGTPTSPTFGDVLAQYSWTPYGELAAVDVLTQGSPPANAIGHQGLFHYRFDGDPTDPALATESQGLVYNRNRWYSPYLGRFTSQDPIESAMPVVVATLKNGESWYALVGGLIAQAHFADGMHLYAYLSSSPVGRRDPLGLFWGLPDLTLGSGGSVGTSAMNAHMVGAASGLLIAMLGAAYVNMQWNVGGGMDAGMFDVFVAGAEATATGAYALGEALMSAAEASIGATLVLGAMTQAAALDKARSYEKTIRKHFVKLITGGGGDWGTGPENWKREILNRLADIEALVKHMGGKSSAKWIEWVLRAKDALDQVLRGGDNMPPPMPG